MNEIFTKLTDQIKTEIEKSLQAKEMQALIVETKAKTDSGNFKFIASTPAVDRQGESVDQAGWELDNYMKNPVLLWAHDYTQPPIGVVDKAYMENGNLVIEGRFAPTDFGQQIRKLYELQMVNTVSVGFIPKEMNGNIITKAELLEVSIVPVPANPQALSLRQLKEAGVELDMLKTKGLEIQAVEEKSAVADRLAAMQSETFDTVAEKYEKVDEVYLAISAFCGVYLQPETTTEQFKELLLETIQILTAIANDEKKDGMEEKNIIAAAIKSEKFKLIEFQKIKAGRVLSEKNRTLIKDTIDGLTATKNALQELYDATEQGEKQVTLPSNEGETKNKTQYSDEDLKAMENWLLVKKLTGAAVTALSEAGAIANKQTKRSE